MTRTRPVFLNHTIICGLMMVVALTGCVSVQKSGKQAGPEAQPPELTSVMFNVDQSHAEVYVDGEFRGTAPINLHLTPGTHKVEFRLHGFQTWERELVVVTGNDTRVSARLQQIQQ